jgi:hypothetical protein
MYASKYGHVEVMKLLLAVPKIDSTNLSVCVREREREMNESSIYNNTWG